MAFRDDFFSEDNRQHNNKPSNEQGDEQTYYAKINERPVKNLYKEIETLINEGINKGYFSKDLGQKLLPKTQSQGNFIFCQGQLILVTVSALLSSLLLCLPGYR